MATAIALIALGGSGGTFGKWKDERGLWMLACVVLALFLPTAMFLAYCLLVEPPKDLVLAQFLSYGDFAASVATFSFQMRLLLTVARHNYRLGEPQAGRES